MSGPYRLHTCPVLALTPEVTELEAWFYQTHQVVEDQWRLTMMPGPGGVGAQDARLMNGLAVARQAANAVLRASRASAAPQTAAARQDEPTFEPFPDVGEAPAHG